MEDNQQIIKQIKCSHADHDEESIQLLCMKKNCQLSRFSCIKCLLNSHAIHNADHVYIKDLYRQDKKLLSPEGRNLSLKIEEKLPKLDLANKIDRIFEDFKLQFINVLDKAKKEFKLVMSNVFVQNEEFLKNFKNRISEKFDMTKISDILGEIYSKKPNFNNINKKISEFITSHNFSSQHETMQKEFDKFETENIERIQILKGLQTVFKQKVGELEEIIHETMSKQVSAIDFKFHIAQECLELNRNIQINENMLFFQDQEYLQTYSDCFRRKDNIRLIIRINNITKNCYHLGMGIIKNNDRQQEKMHTNWGDSGTQFRIINNGSYTNNAKLSNQIVKGSIQKFWKQIKPRAEFVIEICVEENKLKIYDIQEENVIENTGTFETDEEWRFTINSQVTNGPLEIQIVQFMRVPSF